MKKLHALLTSIILIPTYLFSQYGNITPSIGDYFVQGISTVDNTITASDPSAYYIDFYLSDAGNNEIDSLIDPAGGNNSMSWTYDMGLLDNGYYFTAVFYDNNGNYLGENYYQPNIITLMNR